jgi:hypothetical protein
MTTTIAAYLGVVQNLSRYQATTSAEPAVKTASAYYAANIGKVQSIQDLVGNYRLLSYALSAYGLGDQINAQALVSQVLQGGVSNPKSLANTLADPRWKAFATAFDFVGKGAASVSTASAIQTTSADYVEQQLESDQGSQNPGVQLALYFQRVAPTITNSYGILADQNLLEVAQTIFSLSPVTSATDIDAQAASINKLMPLSDLQNPIKLKQLVERFSAMYDYKYGPSSNATTALTIDSGNTPAAPNAATSVMADIITGTGENLATLYAGTASTWSNALLTSLQGFTLGG